VVFFGIKISFIGIPFGGILQLAPITFLSSIVTVFWIVWVLNLLSWSNGVDGQYSGIIGISSIVIALLALRFVPLLPKDIAYARLAVIAAGCSFGLVRYSWYPSKVMWGFSAMSAGAVLAILSILVNAKVATSIIMILIPFLDAVVTMIRRILQKKNPLKGDKGHLHHLLLERGWNVKRIAVFYWATTAIFGLIGLLSSEHYTLLVALTLAGIVAFFIILVNYKSMIRKQESLIAAK
jgi:UDP-GlcNAc:undecaprenyl-phosphate GlcNAc-1-phosphate transferase